jgi:ABC-type multidrug transport system fused ATPase/permease subunit
MGIMQELIIMGYVNKSSWDGNIHELEANYFILPEDFIAEESDDEDHNFYSSSDFKCHKLQTPAQIFMDNVCSFISSSAFALVGRVTYVYKLTAGIIDTFANLALKVAKATKSFWVESQFVDGLNIFAKTTATIGGPLALYQFFKGLEKIIIKDELSKQIDGLLTLTESMSAGLRSTVSSAELLVMGEFVAEKAIEWTSLATLVSIGLSTASIISASKGWYDSHQFLKEMQDKFNHSDKDLGLENILNMKGVKKHFQMNRQALREKIMGVIRPNPDSDITIQVVKALRARVESKIFSHKLTIVACTITLIGAAIFLFTPLAPAAYVIMALAGVISVGKYIYNKQATNIFETEMNRLTQEAAKKKENSSEFEVNYELAGKKVHKMEEYITHIPVNQKQEILLTVN